MNFISLLFSWGDYFYGLECNQIVNGEYHNHLNPELSINPNGNNLIKHCFFEGIKSDGDGGVMKVTKNILMVYSSTFLGCQTSKMNGGAIYYSYTNGQCVISKVCSSGCHSTYKEYSFGQFIWSITKNDPNAQNCFDDSSINKPIKVSEKQVYSLYFTYSTTSISRNNISYNQLNRGCGAYLVDNAANLVSYTTFTNNSCIKDIMVYQTIHNSEVKYCNFIQNTLKESLFHCKNGTVKYYDSVFSQNEYVTIFNLQENPTVNFINCYSDKQIDSIKGITIEGPTNVYFYNVIYNLDTQNCPANNAFSIQKTLSPRVIKCAIKPKFLRDGIVPHRNMVLQ